MEAEEEEQEAWVNALLGRIFWDFLGEKYWSDLVSKKIQMKLSKIKVINVETCTTHSSLEKNKHIAFEVYNSRRDIYFTLICKRQEMCYKVPVQLCYPFHSRFSTC